MGAKGTFASPKLYCSLCNRKSFSLAKLPPSFQWLPLSLVEPHTMVHGSIRNIIYSM